MDDVELKGMELPDSFRLLGGLANPGNVMQGNQFRWMWNVR